LDSPNLKNQGFRLEGVHFFEKPRISKESPKSTLRGAPGPPKRRPKSTPGRPLIDVIGLQNRSWAPPGASDELFLAPGPLPRAIWSNPGAHSWPTLGPLAPQRAPRAHFRPPGGSPGTVFDLVFKVFWVPFRCAGRHRLPLRLCLRACLFQSVNRKFAIQQP